MIHQLFFQLPLGDRSLEDAGTALTAALGRMQELHPYLLEGAMVQPREGVLELRLRVDGPDRYRIQNDARRIAAIMFRRAKMDYRTAVHTKTVVEPSAIHLTKEQGRHYTPRKPDTSIRPR